MKKKNNVREAPAQDRKQEKERKKDSFSARFAGFVAFFALVVAAVLLVVGPVLNYALKDEARKTFGIVVMVAQLFLLAAVALPAWIFVRRRNMFFKAVFFVSLLVFAVGIVLGFAL